MPDAAAATAQTDSRRTESDCVRETRGGEAASSPHYLSAPGQRLVEQMQFSPAACMRQRVSKRTNKNENKQRATEAAASSHSGEQGCQQAVAVLFHG